ncbi:MAG: T9SS type A sorting domain-containing protein, partial [Bacteroidales bacterium]|nr:T9SS type A sorting domain-containing protein [Bacteroidales bacterium]
PGYGNGTQVTLPSAGSDLDIDFNVSLTGLGNGNHVLYVRAKSGDNKWGQVFVEGFAYNCTGIDQEEINSLFKIYPNPGKDNIQIELTDQIQNAFRIRIMDLNGKLVYEKECHNNPYELSLELPGGMYLLTIETGERRMTQKIILE